MAKVSARELGLNLDHWCFACGKANPQGLHLDFEFSRDRAEALFTAGQEHQGYDGMTHGGIVAAVLDEAMGWSVFHQGVWGVTSRLELAFRRPVPVGQQVRVVGEVRRDRGRAFELRGEVRRAADDELLASAEATYVKMSEAQKQALIEKYGDPFPALRRIEALTKGQE